MKFSAQIVSRKIILTVLIIGICGASLLSSPRRAEAQLPVTDVAVAAQAVLTTISSALTQVNTYLVQYKEMILDPLAWIVGNQLLEAMTADVVDWIDNGFDGKPAFLTDPASFFMEQADQLTGAFIDQNGPLQGLCSPFSVDIRLSLALSMSQYGKDGTPNRKRYTCTLGSIINNVKNIPNGISVNGRSIDGFISGDFDQGGWPAFIALTTDQNNNPYSLYLNAQADLNAQIAGHSASINADLNRGGGFLSYTKCEDEEYGGSSGNDTGGEMMTSDFDPNAAELNVGNSAGTKKVCHTETPGSVISGALQKHLGLAADRTAQSDEFTEILTSVFSTFMNKVLTTGLSSVGSKDKNGQTAAAIDELRRDSVDVSGMSERMLAEVNNSAQDTAAYKMYYDQAYNDTINGKNSLIAAQQLCAQNGYSDKVSAIETQIANEVDRRVADYKVKDDDANARYNAVTAITRMAMGAQTPADVAAANAAYVQLIQGRGLVSRNDVQLAKTDASKASSNAAGMRADAQRFSSFCSGSFPQ